MSSNSKNLEAHIEKLIQNVSFFKMENSLHTSNDISTEAEIETDSNLNVHIDEDTGDNFETF